MNLLLQEQAAFDKRAVDPNVLQLETWSTQKTRRIGLHIAKATFQLLSSNAKIIATQVIPDLSICRAQLINTHNVSSDEAGPLKWHHADNSAVLRSLGHASGNLAYYLEPDEQGANDRAARTLLMTEAVQHLHLATESLGLNHNVDVEAAHAKRLEDLLAQSPVQLAVPERWQ